MKYFQVTYNLSVCFSHWKSPSSPPPPVSELRCVCNRSLESPGHKCFQAALTLAVGRSCVFGCATALLTSFRNSPSSSMGKESQDSPLLGRCSGYLYNGRHAYCLVYRFKTANAFLLLSGTVRLGDRSAPNAPVILFLCTISWDNKSVRRYVFIPHLLLSLLNRYCDSIPLY